MSIASQVNGKLLSTAVCLLPTAFCLLPSILMELDGQRLSLAEVVAVARGEERVSLAAAARARAENSRRVVESIIAEDRTVYGVNTGFGKLSDIRIEQSQLRDLQLNLVRSHACGLGAPLSIAEARAMVLLRANVLALGFSGCRPVADRDTGGNARARGHTGDSAKKAPWAPAAISLPWPTSP